VDFFLINKLLVEEKSNRNIPLNLEKRFWRKFLQGFWDIDRGIRKEFWNRQEWRDGG